MPTYSFDCTKCKEPVEDRIRSITADLSLERCSGCSSPLTQRIENGLGFDLKGPGWPSASIKKYEV